ncbi:unnamed protein product, partial [marine sediment metagenome]
MDRRYRVTCMTTPRIDINIAKIAHNAKELKELY